MNSGKLEEKVVSVNRKAFYDYLVLDKYEAGIQLKGTEVKSLREHNVNIKDSFALVKNNEIFLHNMHIGPYIFGNRENHEPLRTRKLLLHKLEIKRLIGKINEKGLTLIPLKIYFNVKGLAKIELGLCKGKKMFDKRDSIKRKDEMREVSRVFKENQYE